MPSLLGNLKLDKPVVARQPKVKHMDTLATKYWCVYIGCIATNSGKVESFHWDSPML
jgi:hypothetical protein